MSGLLLNIHLPSGILTSKKIFISQKWYKEELPCRFVYNNYNCTDSVTSMLQSLHQPTLEVRRQFLKLILMFKILKTRFTFPYTIFNLSPSIQEGTNITSFMHLQCNCEAYRSSFFPSTIRIWNDLPVEIATFLNLNDFINNDLLYIYSYSIRFAH